MNSRDILSLVYTNNTNDRPAIEDENVISGINSIVEFFNATE